MLEVSGVIAANRRYQEDVAIIGNACAAEMGVAEAVDDVVGIMIAGAAIPTRKTRIGTELDHTEGHGRTRKRMPVPAGADERINVASESLL